MSGDPSTDRARRANVRVIARNVGHSRAEPRFCCFGRLEVVEDFLPPPEQLVLKEDGVKITISLSRKSVDFFKAHAAASKVPYQRMIRALLDSYAERFSKRAP